MEYVFFSVFHDYKKNIQEIFGYFTDVIYICKKKIMVKDRELMDREGYKSVSIAIPISMHRRIRARASGDGRTISGFIRTIFNREFCEEKDEKE